MRDAVEEQLWCFMLICAGVGAIFGSVGGVPGMFSNVFIPTLYFGGLVMFVLGVAIFVLSVRNSTS